jgi:hypothetical protein
LSNETLDIAKKRVNRIKYRMKEDLKKFVDTIKNNKFIFVVGLLCICIPPLLFTGNLLINFGPDFTKEGVGQIGDVIGGTTAPFIGLLGAILIYISFQQQVKANQTLEKETNRANFFKVYDTIVDLIDFTIKQYDILLKEEKVQLDKLLNTSTPDKEILKKYRCVLDLVSQCCDCIRTFEVPKKEDGSIDNKSDEWFYKNQLRALFKPHYYLYYRAILKNSLVLLKIDTNGNRLNFEYENNTIPMNNIQEKDVYNDEETKPLKGKMSIYFIAVALKNIIDCMENRNSDDYYQFREISKPPNDK